VTGTLAAGGSPWTTASRCTEGVEAKVRGPPDHGHPVAEASAGQRTAVNLQGVERAALERANVLAHAGTLVTALLVDAPSSSSRTRRVR